jgi:NAD(P)-dependent dehydrogenase (short-subunit alcohol dehydrogenase family)
MSENRVAIVTGANRGIGLEICRQLAKRGGVHVILTARDEKKGKAAAQALRDEGLDVEFHRLDVTSERSARALADFLGKTCGRCDILVNNAGILADPHGTRFLDSRVETYRETLETNVLGPLVVAQALLPLMKKHRYGRIVNVSSGMGQLTDMGTGSPAYRISKTALNALTRILSAEFSGGGILVNSMCPGWVRTAMGGPGAPRSVEQGADTAVWLATLPDGGPSGGLFQDRKPVPW